MGFAVVIPTRFDDIFRPLLESMRLFCSPMPRVIIVADNHDRDYGLELVRYTEPEFSYGKAVNMGIGAAGGDDIVALNDDCRITEPGFFSKLSALASEDKEIGILSPLIRGCAGNPVQRAWEREFWWKQGERFKYIDGDEAVMFPSVWLSREMINAIGLLQEGTGYGGQDVEYCLRARKYGWTTAVTSSLEIQHGDGGKQISEGRGKTWSLSYAKRFPHGTPSVRRRAD